MFSYLSKMHDTISRFSNIVGNYPKTFLFLLRRKLFGQSMTSAQYLGMKFSFRYKDMSAIEETLMRGEYDFILPNLKTMTAPVIVDIGMNIGDFAVMALAHNPHSRVIGIEAHPETAQLAEKNGKTNKGREWIVHNRAAWKNNETIYLETGAASVSTKVSKSGKIAVQGIDLLSLWSLLPEQQIDIMKIDIEGAEEEFLLSDSSSLDRVKHLIVEIHPLACDEERIRKHLNEHFKVVEDIAGRISSKPLLYCRNA